jgi:polysaccharide export outer membrane protein
MRSPRFILIEKEKVMKRVSKLIILWGEVTAVLVLMSANIAVAQNFNGLLNEDMGPEVSAETDVPAEPSADGASSALLNPVDEFPTEGADGIPAFIEENSYYTLGKEDVIEISVMRHPEVSGQFLINNEGKIQYEFIGDVKVEGLKKDEVKNLLTRRLTEYIISPNVTVKIVGYNSKIVYVIGEVGSPGKIFMRGDTITVREALVQAGLPLLSAKAANSRLITPSLDGHPEKKMVNVYKLLYEGDLRENLVMKPGDTLYVPPTFMAKTMRVLQPVAQPISTAAGTGRTVTTGF